MAHRLRRRPDAIDIHTHGRSMTPVISAAPTPLPPITGRYFKLDPGHAATVDESWPSGTRRHNTRGGGVHRRRPHRLRHVPNSIEECRGRDPQQRRADPVRQRRPVARATRCAEVRELTITAGVRGFKSIRACRVSNPTTGFYPVYGAIAAAGVPRCSTPGRRAWDPRCPVGHGIKLRYPTRCCSTTSPRTSRADHRDGTPGGAVGGRARSRSPRTGELLHRPVSG